jgi:hypothetical protein
VKNRAFCVFGPFFAALASTHVLCFDILKSNLHVAICLLVNEWLSRSLATVVRSFSDPTSL